MTATAASIWPDYESRRLYEAQMLTYHAGDLAERYPSGVWPNAQEKPAPGSKEAAVFQMAFVAGIRFACDQLQRAADEIISEIDTIRHEATP